MKHPKFIITFLSIVALLAISVCLHAQVRRIPQKPPVTVVSKPSSTIVKTAADTSKKSTPRITNVRALIVPPTIKILQINPAQPAPGQSITVYFQFANDDITKKIRNGYIAAKSGSASSNKWIVNNLQPGQQISGSVLINGFPNTGNQQMELSYFERNVETSYNDNTNNNLKKGVPAYSEISFDTRDLTVIQTFVDNDLDNMDDNLERHLLEKFRPYFKFSQDGGHEHYNPADALWYISKSELLTSGNEDDSPVVPNSTLVANPFSIFMNGAADITHIRKKTNYHINPRADFSDARGGDLGRHGAPWDQVLALKNIGLYGHVVPVKLNNALDFRQSNVLTGSDAGKTYYKIEYWQFFGYNNANQVWSIADHEGDWTTVQLLVDEAENIITVFHYAHGDEFRFDLQNAVSTDFLENGNMKEFIGRNCCGPVGYGAAHADWDIGIQRAQNNRVRFYMDPITRQYVHPVAYIEYGTHEFWPSDQWDFYAAPKHGGNDYSYLTNTPPNLGEVEHPLQEYQQAEIILRFNGSWGAFSHDNDPPQGPILHKQWTWPANSSIRWQLGAMGY